MLVNMFLCNALGRWQCPVGGRPVNGPFANRYGHSDGTLPHFWHLYWMDKRILSYFNFIYYCPLLFNFHQFARFYKKL